MKAVGHRRAKKKMQFAFYANELDLPKIDLFSSFPFLLLFFMFCWRINRMQRKLVFAHVTVSEMVQWIFRIKFLILRDDIRVLSHVRTNSSSSRYAIEDVHQRWKRISEKFVVVVGWNAFFQTMKHEKNEIKINLNVRNDDNLHVRRKKTLEAIGESSTERERNRIE